MNSELGIIGTNKVNSNSGLGGLYQYFKFTIPWLSGCVAADISCKGKDTGRTIKQVLNVCYLDGNALIRLEKYFLCFWCKSLHLEEVLCGI